MSSGFNKPIGVWWLMIVNAGLPVVSGILDTSMIFGNNVLARNEFDIFVT